MNWVSGHSNFLLFTVKMLYGLMGLFAAVPKVATGKNRLVHDAACITLPPFHRKINMEVCMCPILRCKVQTKKDSIFETSSNE